MSKYYIYQMTAVTEDGSKGSYIGQHKIGRKCPLDDGYKGSGSDWKKYILQRNMPVEKVILRECDSLEQANYWEKYYIEKYKNEGIYLWNRTIGGGAHECNKIYTKEEIAEHKKEYNKQYMKQWREANREKRAEYNKQYNKANKEHIAEYQKQYNKQYREAHKAQIAEHMKEYREANKAQILEHMKEYNKAHKAQIAEYQKQYNNQQCLYNGETLTLAALKMRFTKAGIEHPFIEAKKYIIS